MKQIILILFFLLLLTKVEAQADTQYVKLHFYYGSRPKLKYHKVEKHYFGGLHGGHVSIQIGDSVFSFLFHGKAHIFNHRKKTCGYWTNENISTWVKDTPNSKYASVIIPLDTAKFNKLKKIQDIYSGKEPYDYAFLGMRCASSAYDVFSQIGLLRHRSRFGMVTGIFYPKILRKKIFRMAKKNKWEIIKHGGNKHRKWERR